MTGRERGLSNEIKALLARGRGYGTHSVLDITLSDGTPLHWATAKLMLNGVQYLAKLHELETLKLTGCMTDEVESIPLSVDNVDQTLGTTIASDVNLLDGATGVLGIVFIDEEIDGFIESNIPLAYYDQKLEGDIENAALDDKAKPPVVTFLLVNSLDSVVIMGKTVLELFPALTPAPPSERPPFPIDLPPTRPGGGGGGVDPSEPGTGPRVPVFVY
ncbi:MAG: hypothetical protein ICV60_18205 [Pyrinomonadaceae bacterium]|nr:hypothetical protein [Pyrinomonadaceae bacterium]